MKKRFLAAAALSLCAALAVQAPLSVQAASASDYNYRRRGDAYSTSVSAVEVLEAYLGTPLGETEKEYLAANASFSLNYSSSIGASFVTAPTPEGELLTVTAKPYSYVAENGTEVVWSPVSAELSGRLLAGNADGWSGVLSEGDGDVVSVTFETGLPIAAEDINSYLNVAYVAGQGASEKLKREEARYQSEMEQYGEDLAAYEKNQADWAQYEEDLKAYRDYVAAYNDWKRRSDAYGVYLAEYEKYFAEKAAYEKYQNETKPQYERDLAAYQKYLQDLADYNKALEEYKKNTSSPEAQKALYHLSILSYITKPVTRLERTLSGAILGSSVTQVLSNTELLVLAGASRAVVELAQTATVNLRRLLNEYLLRKTDEDRYLFYIGAHEQLSKNFNDLLRCLDYLYHGFQEVRTVIREYDRTEQFEILLAQLFYVCNALDDNPVGNYFAVYDKKNPSAAYYDSSYRIGVKANAKTPQSVVGADGVLADKNQAAPLETGYPNLPAEPKEPAAVRNPGSMPPAPKNPVEPVPVADPGAAPKTVNEPPMPEVVEKPTLPTAYMPTPDELVLAAAYDGGELAERPPLSMEFVLVRHTSIDKYFRNAKVVTVRFYADAAGEVLLETIDEAPLGSYVEYGGPVPEKERLGYTCIFDGWVDEDGVRVDLNRLQTAKSELSLYPVFAETPNLYSVVWTVDGQPYRDECAFDSHPMYAESKFAPLVKTRTGARLYRFIGWQSGESFYAAGEELPIMTTAPARYTAVFEESFVVTWSVAGRETRVAYWDGEMPVHEAPVRSPDSLYRYTFLGWDREIVPVSADATYTALFDMEYLLGHEGGGTSVFYEDGYYTANCAAVVSRTFTVSGLLTVAAERSAGIAITVAGAKLTFPAVSVYALYESGVATLSVEAVQIASRTYRYSLTYADRAGEALFPEEGTVVFEGAGVFDAENSFLYARKGEESADTRFEIASYSIRFTMRPGFVYELIPQYVVGIVPSELTELSVSLTRARAGERVEIAVGEFPAGMYPGSVYVIAADGTQVVVDGLAFTMPKSAVTVGVVGAYYEYTITFRVDGKVVVTRTYRYGDAIEPPASPMKPMDDEWMYTFVGWDAEIGTVTGDAVFNAVFKAEPRPVDVLPESPLNNIIRIAVVVVPIVLVLLVGLVVLLIVLGVRRRRRKKALAAQKRSSPKTKKGAPMSEKNR